MTGPSLDRSVLAELLALKDLPRTGWARAGLPKPESVADHSWGVALLVLVLAPDELDLRRALGMALLHDLAEVRVGDLTPHDPVPLEERSLRERRAIGELLSGLPEARRDELISLWEAWELGQDPEARFVRACDKLDLGLQALTYEKRGLEASEFLESARAALDPELRALIGESGA